MPHDEQKGADFSTCKKYRYTFYQIWDNTKPLVCWIGLNPSPIHSSNDNPTIKRMASFSKELGFGGFYLVNLYAFITLHPEVLAKTADPIGENKAWLERVIGECDTVIFAWGGSKFAETEAKKIVSRYSGHALGINKNGSPKHPLYVKKGTPLVDYPIAQSPLL